MKLYHTPAGTANKNGFFLGTAQKIHRIATAFSITRDFLQIYAKASPLSTKVSLLFYGKELINSANLV